MQDNLRAMLGEIHSRGIDVVMLGAPQPSLMGCAPTRCMHWSPGRSAYHWTTLGRPDAAVDAG
jgi:hypothetical protein